MRFLDLILKNLMRRKLRTALTGVGVAVAIATVVTLLGISGGFERSATESYRSHGVDLMVVRAGTVQRMSSILDERLRARLSALAGVGQVISSLTDTVSLAGGGPIGVPVHGWPPASPVWDSLRVTEGRRLGDEERDGVLLGSLLAYNLDKHVGDKVDIEQHRFTVRGIYESSNVFENGAAVVSLVDLQRLMDRQGQVSEFMLVLADDVTDRRATLDRLRQEIELLRDDEGQLLGLAALPTEDYVSQTMEIRLARQMAWATSSIALVIGCIGVLNTMVMSVLERTQEIGVLRAIGWRKRRIVKMILGESCLLSMVGAGLGTAVALGLTGALSRFPAARGLIRGDISPDVLGLGLIVAAVVGVLGAAYPAYRGANLQPTEALRYE